MKKRITPSGGAVRWGTVIFLICAQAALCLPVGELSVRTPPCRVLTLAADSDSEWSQAGKPMVRYTLDGREFTAATNAAAVDVCKGTVTLRVGAVLNVLVYVRRDEMQSPFSAVMETSVGDNETVLYTCQDSSTGCVQLINRASAAVMLKMRRSVHQSDDLIPHTTPSLLVTILSVAVGVVSLLGLTVVVAMCAKGSSSYDPIPLSTGSKTVDVPETRQEEATHAPTVSVTSNLPLKLTASTASDDVPLLDERGGGGGGGGGEGGGRGGGGGGGGVDDGTQPGSSPNGTPSNLVVEITLAQTTPTGAHLNQSGLPALESEQAKGGQVKVHVAMENMVVEDGFPYASVSAGPTSKAQSTLEPAKTITATASMAVEDGFPYASVSAGPTSKAQSTLEPAKTITATASMVVEDGFPYASVSAGPTSKAQSTLEPAKTITATAGMVVEDGFPYASVSAGPTSKAQSTLEPPRSAITASKGTSDRHPYASVSDLMSAADNVSRIRSSSSADATDSAGEGISSKPPTGRTRSVTTPESLVLSSRPVASARLSSHQPLPAIPRQTSDLLDEVYDIIPEGLEESKVDTTSPLPTRMYVSVVVVSERGPDEVYESVPEQLLDHARPTPSPPGSPKISPKKGGGSEGRKRAFTFFKKKRDSDDHTPSSPPHAPTFPLPLPPLAPTETSPHKPLDKTMSLPSSARGAGLMTDRVHLPLPALPEDSGSGSSEAIVRPKPRTMEPEDPRYDLVPTGEEGRVKEEEPGYDTVQRVLHLEEDAQSIDLGAEGGDEPGYDSVKRADVHKVQGAQAIEPLEDDPAYDKVKKEGVGQGVEPAEEPGYAKVDRDLIDSILASHQNEVGGQASADEVITLGYAKVTKDPTMQTGDLQGLQQSDETGYATVPPEARASKKEELPRTLPIAHDEQGYALLPSELKEARRGASLKEARRGASLKEARRGASLKGTQVMDTSSPVHQPSSGSAGGPGDQLSAGGGEGVGEGGHKTWEVQMKPAESDTLYSKVNVELKHELRKQRQSYHEDSSTLSVPLSSSPDQVSPNPVVPPLPSSVAFEFPDLDSPPIPQQSDGMLQLVTEPAYATVSKPSVPQAIETVVYAQVGTHTTLQTTTPSHERVKDVTVGYDTVGEVTTRAVAERDVAGYEVIGRQEQHEPLNKDQLEDKVLGYDVVGGKAA